MWRHVIKPMHAYASLLVLIVHIRLCMEGLLHLNRLDAQDIYSMHGAMEMHSASTEKKCRQCRRSAKYRERADNNIDHI